jgi:hypothetical protein
VDAIPFLRFPHFTREPSMTDIAFAHRRQGTGQHPLASFTASCAYALFSGWNDGNRPGGGLM